jgi:mannitol/fructose-specific phosphotransferase system IIA component (Ntr-type)
LEKENFVTPLYRKSVFEREATSSTALETGVAIPHGNPDYVKKTNIAILVNNKKIHWGNEKVDIVMMLSISKNDVKKISPIIAQIYDLISSRDRIEIIFFGKTKEEIYRYF